MMYMLDTNVCIYAINKKPVLYIEKFKKLKQHYIIIISSIVLSELQYGVSNSNHKEQNQINLDNFLSKLEIISYCANSALYYGELRADLKAKVIIIGGNDLLIASHALCENATLITHSCSKFKRVPGLLIENWDEN